VLVNGGEAALDCRREIRRVAFIHPFQLVMRRGIEAYIWELTSAFARRGIYTEIITWDGPVIPPATLDSRVVIRRAVSSRYFQSAVATPFLLYFMFRGKFDHVFVNFAGYGEGTVLRALEKIRPLPFSVVLHYPPALVPHRYAEFEHWSLQRDAANIIAVSQHVALQAEKRFARKCTVIGHGVDSMRFRPSLEARQLIRARLGIPDTSPVLITTAALEERKGIQWVLRALPHLSEGFPDVKYLVLGDGSFKAELYRLSQELGVTARVMFLGAVDDVASYLAAADIGLLLSRGEASPVTLLEYAASGLPVITSQQPPFDELVHPEWGRCLDEEDALAVCHEIANLILNPNARDSMGQNGRRYVQQHHTWEAVAGEYLALVG